MKKVISYPIAKESPGWPGNPTYQAVGAEKLLWSSDYPGMLNHATMRELIDMVVRHSKIPQEDLRKIMGENAKKLWFSD